MCLLGDCVKLRIRSKYQNLILYFMQFADPFSVRAGRRTANWTKARQQCRFLKTAQNCLPKMLSCNEWPGMSGL